MAVLVRVREPVPQFALVSVRFTVPTNDQHPMLLRISLGTGAASTAPALLVIVTSRSLMRWSLASRQKPIHSYALQSSSIHEVWPATRNLAFTVTALPALLATK